MRGRTKANTESVSINDIVETEEKTAEAGELLSSLKELIPTLKQYNEDVRKAENNVINARLGMEGTVTWAEEHQAAIEKRHKAVTDKFDEVIRHVDKLLDEAPTKLAVTVAVSEADKKAIDDKYNEHIRAMNELHDKQMEEMRQAHSQNVTKLYEFGNERYSEINDMLKHSDGFYVSGLWFWTCAIFFWLGVIITIAAIAVWISRNCG